MRTTAPIKSKRLTRYEAGQVEQIAAWKSLPPNPFSELLRKITLPTAWLVEQLIPDSLVRAAIEKAYNLARKLDSLEEGKREAGVADVTELRSRPLEVCDQLASRVIGRSQLISAVEGGLTGSGGMLTTLVDLPLLFVLSLMTIRKIGHCYGYTLDRGNDERFVLGVLLVATSGSLEVRRRRLDQLRQIEDMLLEEAQEEILAEEVASFLFQLEIFEEVPGVGALSGALLNWAFIRRVDVTARRVFQERWLRDNGKVKRIEPAETHPRALATGWIGSASRATYSGCYYIGFGTTLPFWFVAAMIGPRDNALTQGLREGSKAASENARWLVERARGAKEPIPAHEAGSAPAFAPA
jgi:hypothetical protein